MLSKILPLFTEQQLNVVLEENNYGKDYKVEAICAAYSLKNVCNFEVIFMDGDTGYVRTRVKNNKIKVTEIEINDY